MAWDLTVAGLSRFIGNKFFYVKINPYIRIMETNPFAFKTGQEMGLTDIEIEAKADELLADAKKHADRCCPDCAAKPGQLHDDGCDVAHCTECGKQMLLGCKCGKSDVWEGLWPGTTDCYKNKFVCYSTRSGWMFDYNTLAAFTYNKSKK